MEAITRREKNQERKRKDVQKQRWGKSRNMHMVVLRRQRVKSSNWHQAPTVITAPWPRLKRRLASSRRPCFCFFHPHSTWRWRSTRKAGHGPHELPSLLDALHRHHRHDIPWTTPVSRHVMSWASILLSFLKRCVVQEMNGILRQ